MVRGMTLAVEAHAVVVLWSQGIGEEKGASSTESGGATFLDSDGSKNHLVLLV